MEPNRNFCGLCGKYAEREKAQFLILPVPYESTTTYGRGTANGPYAIIDASVKMELYDYELQKETYKAGIHTLPFTEPVSAGPEYMADYLTALVYKETEKGPKTLISIGGEHSISIGIARALKRRFPHLSVLHLDAHADMRNSYEGSPYSHACTMRRVLETAPAVSCGIRSLCKEEAEFIIDSGQSVYYGKSALSNTDKINSRLSRDLYITVDVDIMDPSIMPSTGTPEPGGWTWAELCKMLKGAVKGKNVAGVDITEFSPIPGITAPDFTAAKLIYNIMGYISGEI